MYERAAERRRVVTAINTKASADIFLILMVLRVPKLMFVKNFIFSVYSRRVSPNFAILFTQFKMAPLKIFK